MNKCKWFGHKWDMYKATPPTRYKNLVSYVRLQQRCCKRCGKTEITHM